MVKYFEGYKCLECGVVFNTFYHPQGSIILINGYPIPCSHNGELLITQKLLHVTPWVEKEFSVGIYT
jgi:hypothetical protein